MRRTVVLLALLLASACGETPAPASDAPGTGRALRVAAVQFDARPADADHNRAEMERLAREAAALGAELVLFHENALLDYGPRVRELAEAVPAGPACTRMAALARELGLWIGFGLAEREGDSVYLTHAHFGPDGYAGRYRKTWLFHAPGDERRDEWAHFDPGSGPALLEIAGLRTAVMLCSDADSERFVARVAALEPELVLFPNNRSHLPEAEAFVELVRRLRAPLVLANRVGASWQHDCNGGSAIYAGDGRILGRANRDGREQIVLCDVPLDGP